MFQPHPYHFSAKKRILDFTVASLGFIITLPLFIVISILIKFSSSGPVFFVQKRAGRGGRPFTIYKFRTMYVGAQKDKEKYTSLNISPYPTFKISNDPRFVGVGRLLSKFGLDELPQLINIIKGDMSIVGPRPLPLAENAKLPAFWKFRTAIKPGIISTWLASGRNHLTAKQWSHCDKDDLIRGGIKNDLRTIIDVVISMGK